MQNQEKKLKIKRKKTFQKTRNYKKAKKRYKILKKIMKWNLIKPQLSKTAKIIYNKYLKMIKIFMAQLSKIKIRNMKTTTKKFPKKNLGIAFQVTKNVKFNRRNKFQFPIEINNTNL